MTVTKSNCFHNSPVSSSSRLVGKIKPHSVFGLIAQSSRFVLKSFNGLQSSFFASSTFNRFKQPSKPLTIVQPTSPVITRVCGPMELRGIQLILKFGSIVRNIDERLLMTNQHILEPLKPLSSEVNLNAITVLPTLVVDSAPISKSSLLTEILEASKLRNERRSKPVSLDALATSGTHEILSGVNKNTDDQKGIVEVGDVTIKMSGTTASRPALFSAFELKSVQLKKTDCVRNGPFSSTPMSLDSLRNRHSESNRIKLLESPLNALGKKKFKISDVLNVKLRPIRSRNSNGSKKLDSDVRGVKEVKNNGRQMPVNSYIAQSMRVPPISLHSALKAALAKKFDKAVTDSSARVEEAEAESPMSQW